MNRNNEMKNKQEFLIPTKKSEILIASINLYLKLSNQNHLSGIINTEMKKNIPPMVRHSSTLLQL